MSSKTGTIALASKLAGTIPSFLVSGFYASVANRYGRKVAMICPAIGLFCSSTVLFFMAWVEADDSKTLSVEGIFWYSLLGGAFEGVLGSFSAFQMGAFSYASDITRDDKAQRGAVFSMLEASVFFAKTIAPLAGGFYAQYYNFVVPMLTAVVMCLLVILWCLFVMLELCGPDYSVQIRWNPWRSFRNVGLLLGLTAVELRVERDRENSKEGLEEGTSSSSSVKCYPSSPLF